MDEDLRTDAPSDHLDPDASRMLHVDARPVVYAGTILFAIGFVVLLPFWSWLGDHGARMWIWTCLAGALLGLAGLPLISKHESEGRLG